ncbi:MAG TPA: hypothetical protein VGC41_12480 [Kofleriaceae bacterium]
MNKQDLVGRWQSLAVEVRPSKNPDGTIKPFFLRRDFTYAADDTFSLAIDNFADPFGQVVLAKIAIRGHTSWQGAHPVAPGAEKVSFTADLGYDVTPLHAGFRDVLAKVAAAGYAPWEVGGTQSVFGKSFLPFGLVEGKNFMEYDLVYLAHGLMFWGARNVDGRGFDTEANRPTSLQIPMARS